MAVPFDEASVPPSKIATALVLPYIDAIEESDYDAPAVLVTSRDVMIPHESVTVDVKDSVDSAAVTVECHNDDLLCASKPGSKTVVIYDCSEYCQVVQILPRNEQRLEFKTHFSKAVEHRQTHPVKIIDRGDNVGEKITSIMTDTNQNSFELPLNDRFSDEGVHSEPLILSGTSLHNIGIALAWIYCNTRLSLLCQDMPGRKNCSRFPKMLPKLVVLCSLPSEDEISHAGYIASKSSQPDTAYCCEVCNVEYGDEEYQVIVDCPQQLRVLQNLMERGKLTEKQCEIEKRNFVEYVRDKCKKIPLLSGHCIVVGNLDSENIFQEIMFKPPTENGASCDIDEAFDDEADLCIDGEAEMKQDDKALIEGRSFCPSTDVIIVVENADDSDDDEPIWMISSSLSCSVRSENCDVLHLNTNMVAASLKQSGLITDRAYSQLMANEDTLTRNALKFLWLLVERSSNCYNLFIEAAQALCSRAMKSSRTTTNSLLPGHPEDKGNSEDKGSSNSRGRHVNNVSEQNNRTGKTAKQHKHTTLDEENLENSEKPNLTNEDKENNSLLSQQGEDTKTVVSETTSASDTDQKRSVIIGNLLFAMIEDTKYLPHDFEVQLRKAVLEHKVDVANLRNKEGCSLLHFVLLQNRTQFIQPLFRTGCWKTLQNLTVEMENGSEHAGKTADDIVIEMRSRKLQKELDTYTVWEKSLNLIHYEARIGNFAGVKRWLEYSSDLHTELDCMKCSTLYWACIGGNVDIVKLLLSLRVEYGQINTRKESLLHAACMMGHHQLIEILVKECQPDFTLKDTAKKTPALRASENGDEKCLAKLVECGMPREQLGSVLAIAGHYGRVACLQSVIEQYHVDPQSKDDAGKSALHRASEQGRLEVLRYLFTKNLNFEEVDTRKRNILHVSADGASTEVVTCIMKELKRRRLNVKKLINARDKYIGGELCMLIRGKDKGRESWHYVEVSRGLMDIFMRKTRGGTIDVAKYGTLLFSGWGPDPDDNTAQEIEKRFEARRNNNLEDPDATPLHIAAFKDKSDVAELLLDHGADPNVRDKFGMTPLHVAAMRGNIGLVKRLIALGATPEALDCLVKTPADMAEDNEHKAVANYLKGVKYLPVAEHFRERVLPNIQQLIGADNIRSVHESGADLRTHLINALRDLTVDINETLLSLGSGPVLEESSHRL